jgi:hypothetical protein
MSGKSNALVPLETLVRGGIVTTTALVLDDPDLTVEQWATIGHYLGTVARAARWWIGDWISFGERAYGERYSQAVELTGYDEGYLRDLAYIARNVHPSVRTDALGISHHKLVAPLERREQRRWLKAAAENGWSRERLRAELRAERQPIVEVVAAAQPDVLPARTVADTARALTTMRNLLADVEDGADVVDRLPLAMRELDDAGDVIAVASSVVDAARALLAAAVPTGDGFVRVPKKATDELAARIATREDGSG